MNYVVPRPLRDDEKLPVRTHHIVPDLGRSEEQNATLHDVHIKRHRKDSHGKKEKKKNDKKVRRMRTMSLVKENFTDIILRQIDKQCSIYTHFGCVCQKEKKERKHKHHLGDTEAPDLLVATVTTDNTPSSELYSTITKSVSENNFDNPASVVSPVGIHYL